MSSTLELLLDPTAMATNATGKGGISKAGDVSFNDLYTVIIQCFAIILSGYVAGRLVIVTRNQSQGIGAFVSKFCLPALLFKSMCELDFGQVSWLFLVGILIAKCSVFLLVILVTLGVKRPLNLGYAGIFAIFATQSNDFALGLPILQALYSKSHSEYLKYIYLIAPISLVLLNPIGFILLEIHKHRSVQDESGESKGLLWSVWHVFKGIVTSPIVFMTAIGLAGNFVFHGTVPNVLRQILTVLAEAYNASALFYLGLSMVGKVKGQLGLSVVVPVLLIIAKTLILPLITWEVVGWLEIGKNDTTSYSMYGFLYGTFPTAPSVFLYASEYGVATDMIATGLVLGTFLSAPLMFVSAKMMTVVADMYTDYRQMLLKTSFEISIISLTFCLWVLIIFVVTGRWRRVPHRFTFAFAVSHMLACIGMITSYFHEDLSGPRHYPVIIMLLVGVFASRVWTAVISIVLCLLKVRGLCFVLKIQFWLFFAGFGIPVFVTGLIFLVGSHNIGGEIDPSFHYGLLQTIFSLIILVLSFLVTLVSLIIWQRTERHIASAAPGFGDNSVNSRQSYDPARPRRKAATDQDFGAQEDGLLQQSSLPTGQAPRDLNKETKKKSTSLEDLIPFPNSVPDDRLLSDGDSNDSENPLMEAVTERTCLISQCTPQQRRACVERLRNYAAVTTIIEDSPQDEDIKTTRERELEEYQTTHHLVLILLLLLSMCIGMFLCLWRSFHKVGSGIYLEIEYLDGVFNYGQGLLLVMVFGFDTRLVFSPLMRRQISKYRIFYMIYVRLRRLLFGAEFLHLPKMRELNPETKQICQQFTDYHKENCSKEIVRDHRFRFRVCKDVFTGSTLCDWLIRAGLACDRDAAVDYGKKLLVGRVITHVSGKHHFHDEPYYYKFLDTFEYMAC